MRTNVAIINRSNTFITLDLETGEKTLSSGQRVNNVPAAHITSKIRHLAAQGSLNIVAMEATKPMKIKASDSNIKLDKKEKQDGKSTRRS